MVHCGFFCIVIYLSIINNLWLRTGVWSSKCLFDQNLIKKVERCPNYRLHTWICDEVHDQVRIYLNHFGIFYSLGRFWIFVFCLGHFSLRTLAANLWKFVIFRNFAGILKASCTFFRWYVKFDKSFFQFNVWMTQ